MEFDPHPQNLPATLNGDLRYPEAEEDARRGVTAVPAIDAELTVSLTHWRTGFTQQQLDDPRIHATRISPQQAVVLKLLTTSLNEQGERMANGRYVQTAPDALRYLLDHLVDQVPAELMTELVRES